jgi:uncharacterized protein YecT (DUF1311 family)
VWDKTRADAVVLRFCPMAPIPRFGCAFQKGFARLQVIAVMATVLLFANQCHAIGQPHRPYSDVFNKCIDVAVATLDILDCYKHESELWDRRLAKANGALMSLLAESEKHEPLASIPSSPDIAYPRDTTRLDLLRRAQQAWTAFRDADCLTARLPAAGGSLANILAADCRLDHVVDRTLALESRLEDYPSK